MDKEFQRARDRQRQTEKTISGHLASGVTSFGRGIVMGLTGVVTQPLQGLRENGVGGLIEGTFKGAVGAVAKPLAGVFDLASSTTAAVRSSAGQTAKSVERARPPRMIAPDLILRPYRRDEADGRQLLMRLNNGEGAERFVANVQVGKDIRTSLLVSSDRIIVLGAGLGGGIGVTAELW